ncbi:MAG TPA: DUF3800 domain-containing protein [Polyangia bacterium]|jgi:hypothetical protein
MSFILFIDESGHDLRESPYEVLAGVAVEDSRIWNLISALQDAEVHLFGGRITTADLELKGKKLLKRKTFRLAQQLPPLPADERTALAQECLRAGRSSARSCRWPTWWPTSWPGGCGLATWGGPPGTSSSRWLPRLRPPAQGAPGPKRAALLRLELRPDR